nr:zinc finger MYM-type protein 1-like [Lytechinus pictus]
MRENPREFLEFKAAFQLDAESLTNYIFDILKSHGVDYKQFLVGQGYDGASVMSGKISGVSARVRKEAKYAYYVHCHAHRLNLVLVDVTKGIPDAAQFFSLLEKLYVFVSGSYVHSKWIDIQKDMYPGESTRELKRLSDTRWACRVEACRVIRDRFPALTRLLEEISNEAHADRAIDARGLLAQLNAEFLMKLVIMTNILIMTNQLSTMLQSSEVDLAKAADLTGALVAELQDMRSNPQTFNRLWDEVQTSVRDQGFDVDEIDPSHRKRKRRLPKRLEEAALLDPLPGQSRVQDEFEGQLKDKIKTKFFYQIIDRMLSELNRRFNSETCQLMKSIQALSPRSEHFLDFGHMDGFAQMYNANLEDLKHEVHSIKRLLERRSQDGRELPQTLPEFVNLIQPFGEAFREIYRLARIAVVLPVTSSACERSFSALKLIKTFLRNSMGNARLSNLGILSIEAERVTKLNLDLFVDEFAKKNQNRRIILQ